jgi:hypothetical protein
MAAYSKTSALLTRPAFARFAATSEAVGALGDLERAGVVVADWIDQLAPQGTGHQVGDETHAQRLGFDSRSRPPMDRSLAGAGPLQR